MLYFWELNFPISSSFVSDFILVHFHSQLFVPAQLDFTSESRLCYEEGYFHWQGWLCRKLHVDACTHRSLRFPWQLSHVYHPKILCLTWMWWGRDVVPLSKCSRTKWERERKEDRRVKKKSLLGEERVIIDREANRRNERGNEEAYVVSMKENQQRGKWQ